MGYGEPRWDLVVDMTLALWRTGTYLAGVWHPDEIPTFRVAAAEASRLCGAEARVDVADPIGRPGPPVVVRVTLVADAAAARKNRQGLDSLRDAVRRQHAA